MDALLKSEEIEQQSYRTCLALIKLAEKLSPKLLEHACEKALTYSANPSYKSIKNILAAPSILDVSDVTATDKPKGITRGADYYRR